jgi:signal transduction histidine kinase
MPEMLPPLANDATALLVHDVGNYIQIAMSAIRLMSRHDDFRSSHEFGAMLAHAAASLERAGALIRVSRDPGGAAHEDDIHLDECLVEMAPLLRYATGPHVRVRLHVGTVPKVRVNRLGLQNVMVNLAINARDAMQDGGVLTISALLADGPEIPEVEIVVTDTGRGMEGDVLARVFEPRFSTKPTGNGIGLASVRQFIEETGGRVAIDSIPGKGTAVTLRLPASS